MEIDLTSRGRQGGKSQDTRVALWYYRQHSVYVELCLSQLDAAASAYWMLNDGNGSPEGVQFPDGRFIQLSKWPLYEQFQQEQRRIEAAEKPPEQPPTRQVRVPWTCEERTVQIPADLPAWVGRPVDG